jgi:hypothetical protein
LLCPVSFLAASIGEQRTTSGRSQSCGVMSAKVWEEPDCSCSLDEEAQSCHQIEHVALPQRFSCLS